ncbi:DUF6301 family protein [Actinomyces bowdenii]|uniref:DUF6301 family protein n=1 Tax=Actinomyces bowdenii TaxID=131109 RepID=UPI00214AC4D6|nr:DUF6301 family protein [Actinomyces bowdenii]MCR2053851.1 DUF6301 family protein [Actinomyces bowdenii]
MMAEMRILPVERAIEWIRAWTELEWPITWETAYAIRDRLGWVPAPDDGRFFVTELSVNGEEDGSINTFNGHCSGVYFPLSSRNLSVVVDEAWKVALRSTYDRCVTNLAGLYGVSKRSREHARRMRTEWELDGRITLSLAVSDKSASVTIDSPKLTEINEWELHYIEKYGENYVED